MQVGKLQKRKIIKNTLFIAFCVYAGWFLKARLTPQMPGMMGMSSGEPYVLVQSLQTKNVAPKRTYIGHVEPIKSVNLKPQITGYVEKVLFQEGSLVNEGDILFVIEPQRYLATVELREAELAKAEASLVKIEKDYKRQASLNKQKFASEATLDSAYSDLLQAKAAVKQAKANLELAKIDVDYTQIKAPITGYIGKALVTEGNYVASTLQTLARIVQVNPIRVAFSVSDKDMLKARKLFAQDGENAMKTELVLPNGETLNSEVLSRFADNEINTNTATITIYTEYNNDNLYLTPGNYVDIRVGTDEDQIALLVPQAAIAQDANGAYVYTVNNDNIAEQKRVILGEIIGDMQVVSEGLEPEDKVIIQGLQKVKNGAKVKVSEAKIETEIK